MKETAKRRNIIQRNIIIATTLGVVMATGLVAWRSSVRTEAALINAATNQIAQANNSAAKNISSWLENRTIDISVWAAYPSITTYFTERTETDRFSDTVSEQLRVPKEAFPWYEAIAVADSSGHIAADSTGRVTADIDVAELPFFQASMAGEQNISTVSVSPVSGNPIFTISTPVVVDGEIAGVLFAVVDIHSFTEEFINPITVGETGYTFLYDGDGQILAHPNEEYILEINLNDQEWSQEMMTDESGEIDFRGDEADLYIHYSHDPTTGWGIATVMDHVEIHGPVRRLQLQLLYIAVPGVILVAAVVLVIASRLMKPLRGLSDAMRGIAGGDADLTVSLVERGHNEITYLSKDFNAFIAGLAQIIAMIRSILSDTRSIRENLAELTDRSVADTEQISGGIDSIQEQISRLDAAINKSASAVAGISTVIERFDGTIREQATAVEQSSAAIEQMMASISNVGKVATTKEQSIKSLSPKHRTAAATSNGPTPSSRRSTGGWTNSPRRTRSSTRSRPRPTCFP